MEKNMRYSGFKDIACSWSLAAILGEVAVNEDGEKLARKIMRLLNDTHEMFVELQRCDLSPEMKRDAILLFRDRQVARMGSIEYPKSMRGHPKLTAVISHTRNVISALSKNAYHAGAPKKKEPAPARDPSLPELSPQARRVIRRQVVMSMREYLSDNSAPASNKASMVAGLLINSVRVGILTGREYQRLNQIVRRYRKANQAGH